VPASTRATSTSATTTSTFPRSSSRSLVPRVEPATDPVTVRLGPAWVRWSGRSHGHVGLARPEADDDNDGIASRRVSVVDLPWSWLHQVHGNGVVIVDEPGGGPSGTDADAMVTRCPGAALAVFTADCAPIALASPDGVIGLAHAGWRGLLAGVVERTVDAMTSMGATTISAALGPCIRAGCYEFGVGDLDDVAAVLGPGVRSTTTWGAPALDLGAAARAALERAGARLALDTGACTACTTSWYSHRARAETERQATVVWLDRRPVP
jgi:hypothetical protein